MYPRVAKYHAVVDIEGSLVEADFADWCCPSDVLHTLKEASGAETGRDLLISVSAGLNGSLKRGIGLIDARILDSAARVTPVASIALDSRLA